MFERLIDYGSSAQREDGGKKSGMALLSVLADKDLVKASGVRASSLQKASCVYVWF
jgi:hypothetical protein